MRMPLALLGAAVAVGLSTLPAFGKTDAKDTKKKDVPIIHWAHTYAAALEEAQDRGTVVFATFHIDH